MTHGYENIGIENIRDTLRNEYGIVDEDVIKQTKKHLIELIQQLKEDDNSLVTIEEDDSRLDILAEIEPEDETEEMVQPAFGSEKWNEWLRNQLHNGELENDHPNTNGCRRLVREILGPISKVEIIDKIGPIKDNDYTATVVIGVTIPEVILESHPRYQKDLYFEDIADAGAVNTPTPYSKHASATAATRAEGRCYRKLLEMHCITAEEALGQEEAEEPFNDAWETDDPINDTQIEVIDLICSRNGLSVMDFINCGKHTYTDIRQISQSVARTMVKHLNGIQTDASNRPDGIGKYNPAWRDKSEQISST